MLMPRSAVAAVAEVGVGEKVSATDHDDPLRALVLDSLERHRNGHRPWNIAALIECDAPLQIFGFDPSARRDLDETAPRSSLRSRWSPIARANGNKVFRRNVRTIGCAP